MSDTRTTAEPVTDLRAALGELLAAERRLRARDRSGDDLTFAQTLALATIHKGEHVTAGQIARHAGLNPASVTSMLDQLEAKEIIARVRSKADRRVVEIELTQRGRELLEAKRARWEREWTSHFSDADEGDLLAAAATMRSIAALLDELPR